MQAGELEPRALRIGDRHPSQAQIERDQTLQTRDLNGGLGIGQDALEHRADQPVPGTGLREGESGANQEQDKTEPGPERKADASEHLALRSGAPATAAASRALLGVRFLIYSGRSAAGHTDRRQIGRGRSAGAHIWRSVSRSVTT